MAASGAKTGIQLTRRSDIESWHRSQGKGPMPVNLTEREAIAWLMDRVEILEAQHDGVGVRLDNIGDRYVNWDAFGRGMATRADNASLWAFAVVSVGACIASAVAILVASGVL